MNNKKNLIKLWSFVLIITMIVNIIFFTIILKRINFEFFWIADMIIYGLIAWTTFACAFLLISIFSVKYKNLTIEDNEIEIYSGFINHYIKINNQLKDEYKGLQYFSPIKLSCLVKNRKLEVTISTSNNIVVKLDNELI